MHLADRSTNKQNKEEMSFGVPLFDICPDVCAISTAGVRIVCCPFIVFEKTFAVHRHIFSSGNVFNCTFIFFLLVKLRLEVARAVSSSFPSAFGK